MTQIDEPHQRNCIYRLKGKSLISNEYEKTENYT